MNDLVIGFVPGVTPRRWFRTWAERRPDAPLRGEVVQQHEQELALRSGQVRMCLVREPFDLTDHHLIPLYEELAVVVAPADHVLSVVEEVSSAEIDDEVLDLPPSMPWQDRVHVAAGGSGLTIAPMSVAREFHRKDLIWRPVIDLPPTRVGLAWLRGQEEDPLIEEFIGIVRGRSANSSRGSREPVAKQVRQARQPSRTAQRPPRRPPRKRRGR